MAFLPVNMVEARSKGWSELDVIFVTGDAYVDHPSFGVPLLARWLEHHGFRTGIIAQPDWRTKEEFMALGRPRLFFAVSAGAMDSMVAHYTPAKKIRRDDAYTPGNRHGARPNRAVLVYTARLKEAYRDVPVVIGGIEASLRRLAHYDYWDDRVRRSILFDAKADLLIYGMGERPLLELANRLRAGEPWQGLGDIRGTAFVMDRGTTVPHLVQIPSFEEVSADKRRYAEAFRMAASEQQPFCGKKVGQYHGERLLVCNPPALPLSQQELDMVYALPFMKAPHPSYREAIPAYDQIKCSITTHRGCFGGCAFCAITHHQGKFIQSRSVQSILDEIGRLTRFPWFKGTVSDVGGPTANMYGLHCASSDGGASCRKESCLFPAKCRHLEALDKEAVTVLERGARVEGVRHLHVTSGVRYDLLEYQKGYMRRLLAHHVSGLLKVAPEHLVNRVTSIMRKPGMDIFERFLASFRKESSVVGKIQHIVPYFMSSHPGCRMEDMLQLALLLRKYRLKVEQVQDFTPTPGTLATCMYHTGLDPYSNEAVHVTSSEREKRLQKALLLNHLPGESSNCLEALQLCGREDALKELLPAYSVSSGYKGRLSQAKGKRSAAPGCKKNFQKKT